MKFTVNGLTPVVTFWVNWACTEVLFTATVWVDEQPVILSVTTTVYTPAALTSALAVLEPLVTAGPLQLYTALVLVVMAVKVVVPAPPHGKLPDALALRLGVMVLLATAMVCVAEQLELLSVTVTV